MGTIFHGAGHILSLAMRNNRILLWNHAGDNAPGRNFIDPGCGGSPGYENERSLDCIFEKISSCTLQDVTPDNSVKVKAYWGPPDSLTGTPGSVPPVLGYAMKQLYPDIAPDGLKYWWRTQSVGFLMRLNGAGMRRIKELRTTAKMHHAVMTHGETKSVEELTVPFPLPAGTFSMHVRHGDKAVEMNLVPMSKYIEVAHEYIAQNPLTSLKSAFISTEDNAIFEEAKATFAEPVESTTSMKDWVFYYSDIPRLNGGPEEQLNAFGNRTEMTCKWVQQLIMALECDLIIGTRGSGWNRMIDELRCVWGTGGGCKAPFMEVGPFEDWVGLSLSYYCRPEIVLLIVRISSGLLQLLELIILSIRAHRHLGTYHLYPRSILVPRLFIPLDTLCHTFVHMYNHIFYYVSWFWCFSSFPFSVFIYLWLW